MIELLRSRWLVPGAALLGVACAVTGIASLSVGRQGPPNPEIAKIITTLPPAGEEMTWDPALKEWKEHPGAIEIRRRILAGQLNDADWGALVARTRPIYSHARWRRTEPYAVGIAYPTWVGGGEIRATPRIPGGCAATAEDGGMCGVGIALERQRRSYQEVGVVAPETKEVTFDVEISATGRWSEGGRDRITWSGAIALPVEVVEPADRVVEPVHDAAFDEWVRSSFRISVARAPIDTHPTLMWVFMSQARATAAPDPEMSVYLDVAVEDSGRVLQRMKFPFTSSIQARMGEEWFQIADLGPEILENEAALRRLELHITPDREAAFRDLRRDRAWDGEIVVPVTELMSR